MFVGRQRELAELGAALREVMAGRGQLAIAIGEPGIGKTRLADELAGEAVRAGAEALWGRCWEEGGAPLYWPWVQILRSYLARTPPDDVAADVGAGAAYVAQLVPELRLRFPDVPEPPQELSAEQARFALLDAVTTLIVNASARRPLVVVIDDAHAADLPSVRLLQLLARRIRDAAILLYVSFRQPEARRDAQLAEVLGELAREGHILQVRGLSRAEVAQYVAAATTTRASASVIDSIHRSTEGNPLFVSEMVRLLEAEGALGQDEVVLTVPQGVQQTIRRRLAHLAAPVIDVLEVAAALGRDFDLTPLQEVTGVAPLQLLDALGEGVDAGILVEVAEAPFRYRFAHPLVREALYRGMPNERRAILHRRVGEVLEQHHQDNIGPHLAELAHHFFQAAPTGEAGKAVEYNEQAARRAARLYAYDDAAARYERALDAISLTAPADEPRRARLLLDLGRTQDRAGRVDDARQAFLRAASAARALEAPELLAEAAVGYGRATYASGAVDWTLVELLEEALARLGTQDSALWVDVATRLAIELYAADTSSAVARRSQLARDALSMARRVGDPAMLTAALEAATAANAGPDNVDERLAAGTEIIRLSDEVGRRESRQSGHVWRLAALLEQGDMPGLDREIEAYGRLADELQQPAHRWYAATVRVARASLAGRFPLAERLCDEALRIGQRGHGEEAVDYHTVQRFIVLREQRRTAELATMEEAMRRLAGSYPALPAFRAALARLLWEIGQESEARHELAALAQHGFADLPRNLGFLAAIALVTELSVDLDERGHAEALYVLLVPYAEHNVVLDWSIACFGSASRYLGLLARLAGRHDDAIDHLRAATEANARMGAQPFLAHTQLELGQELWLRGAPGDAEEAAALAEAALGAARAMGMGALADAAQRFLSSPSDRPVQAARRLDSATRDAVAVFRQEGEYWTVTFGERSARLKDAKGLRYLAQLLRQPGREFHVLDLAAALAGAAPGSRGPAVEEGLAIGLEDAGPVLDAHAKAAYRQRLDQLRAEIDEAEAVRDPFRVSRARDEMDFLVAELSRAVGLGGRDVRAASTAERARQSVRRSIKSSLCKIAEANPALGQHLSATLRTGYFCSYTPDPRAPIAWEA